MIIPTKLLKIFPKFSFFFFILSPLLLVGLLGGPIKVLATQVESRVQVYYGETEVGAPRQLAGSALSESSVRLTWNVPDIGQIPSGYRIYRDGQVLADVSELYYLDAGLIPATTYVYFVRSLDSIGRESPSSNLVSVSTFATPIPIPPITIAGRSGTDRLQVKDFKVWPSVVDNRRFLLVSLRTNWVVASALSYGDNSGRVLGTIQGTHYSQIHTFLVEDLPLSERYFLDIKLKLSDQTIFNLDRFYVSGEIFGRWRLPADVRDLQITSMDQGLLLRWRNPILRNDEKVYVVRADKFYPRDRFSGWPLWQGRGESFLDREPVSGQDYYYGIFVCNVENFCSPGAYLVVRLRAEQDELLIAKPPAHLFVDKNCEKRFVFGDQNFKISVPSAPDSDSWLYLLRLFKDGNELRSYKLTRALNGQWETSNLSINHLGFYHYLVTRYDIFGANPEDLSCGEIAVVSEGSPGLQYDWLPWIILLLLLLILLLFFLLLLNRRWKIFGK